MRKPVIYIVCSFAIFATLLSFKSKTSCENELVDLRNYSIDYEKAHLAMSGGENGDQPILAAVVMYVVTKAIGGCDATPTMVHCGSAMVSKPEADYLESMRIISQL